MFRFGFCDGVSSVEDGDTAGVEEKEEEEDRQALVERMMPREVQPLTENAACDVNEEESTAEVRAIEVHGGLSVSYWHGAGAGDGASDLVRGEYEGGFKLWEGAIDLLEHVSQRVRGDESTSSSALCLNGRSVCELGCGHGLPGIACVSLFHAKRLMLQDYNDDVLGRLTARNVALNTEDAAAASISYVAGAWSGMRAFLDARGDLHAFDLVLSAETAYQSSNIPSLVDAIHACLARNGSGIVATKRYYFGVGGGTEELISAARAQGGLAACVVGEKCDGTSNVRDIVLIRRK